MQCILYYRGGQYYNVNSEVLSQGLVMIYIYLSPIILTGHPYTTIYIYTVYITGLVNIIEDERERERERERYACRYT